MTRFAGKAVLVTGSSRNLGKAIAARFTEEGAAVAINARESGDELRQTAEELRAKGRRVLPLLADVGDPEAVRSLVRQTEDAFGGIDVLVMSHAIRPLRRFLDVTPQEWHEVMSVNLHSAYYLCQAALPGMVARGGGSVIVIGGDFATGSGFGSKNTRPHVFASLAGRAALIRTLITEFGPHNIRFNFVNPGVMNTFRKHPEWYPASAGAPAKDSALIATIPMGRIGEPGEVADAVLWLASDEASYVSGTTMSVNGGWHP
jgi:3-oxoacyl-[acyl-carrier protein] reductase